MAGILLIIAVACVVGTGAIERLTWPLTAVAVLCIVGAVVLEWQAGRFGGDER